MSKPAFTTRDEVILATRSHACSWLARGLHRDQVRPPTLITDQGRRAINVSLAEVGNGASLLLTDNRRTRSVRSQHTNASLCKLFLWPETCEPDVLCSCWCGIALPQHENSAY